MFLYVFLFEQGEVQSFTQMLHAMYTKAKQSLVRILEAVSGGKFSVREGSKVTNVLFSS